MSIDLIIRSGPSQVEIALMRDGTLSELHREKSERGFTVGDIYLGKVRKVAPSLNAAFVDVGYEKDAFLHYFDLGPQYRNSYKFTKGAINGSVKTPILDNWELEDSIDKHEKIQKVLSASQNVLVQIAKEPISTKGPRLSAEVTLAGRYAVLVPFTNKISLSSRIQEGSERDRLRRLYSSIKPDNFGLIIRTQAKNKKVAELDADIKSLIQRWDVMFRNLRNGQPPKKILGEIDRTSAVLRDLVSPDFSNIIVNDEALAEEIREYMEKIAPEKKDIVKAYSGKLDIFDNYPVNKQIKASFGRHVALQSGAYLIVEHTEAMHVIDVNSGSRKGGKDKDQEELALEINIEAAQEVARILRLRDMGGIIVVDFIDLYSAANRRALQKALKDAMAGDKAKHNVLAPSRFGVVEMTRQRVRPETDIDTSENCPACNGTGQIGAPVLVIDEIENALNYLITDKGEKKVTLAVHPFIHAFLTKGVFSKRFGWWRRWKIWVNVVEDGALQYMDFLITDAQGDELTR